MTFNSHLCDDYSLVIFVILYITFFTLSLFREYISQIISDFYTTFIFFKNFQRYVLFQLNCYKTVNQSL